MDCQVIAPRVSSKRYFAASQEHRYSDFFFQSIVQNLAMLTMGTRIRNLRKAKLLTQKQLAEMTGLAQNTISDLERGDSKTMEASTLRALCAALVTTPGYVLDGIEVGEQDASMMEEAELLAIFRDLPPHSRTALLGSARLLKAAVPPR